LRLGTFLSAKAIWAARKKALSFSKSTLFSFGTLRMRSRSALQWGMKVKVPKPSSPDPRVREIQQWTKTFGSGIANAYVVNTDALRELSAERGVIEKILWR